MSRRYLIALALAAVAALAVPAVADAQRPISGAQVQATRTVAPNATVTFSVPCRRGFVAVSGAVVAYQRSILVRSAPLRQRSWSFTLRNSSNQPDNVQVAVNCLRVRRPRVAPARLRLRTARTTASVPAQQARQVNVACPRGHAPGGYGAGVRQAGVSGRARASGIGQIGLVAIQTARPVRGGWQFTLANQSSADASVTMYARCVPRKLRVRRRARRRAPRRSALPAGRRMRVVGAELLIVIRRRSITQRLGPLNNDGIRHDCTGQADIATRDGHDMGTQNAFLFTSWAHPRDGGTWNIVNAQTVEVDVTLYLLCVDARATWRPF